MRALTLLFALLPVASVAQDLSFRPEVLETCLADGGGDDCIGLAAARCAESTDGGTTVGLGFCYGAERDWWDARLNAAYQDLMARERAIDAETDATETSQSRATALRNMQRAWIAFRDAACFYEYTQWGGGTGGNPAHAACTLRQTAIRTLALEARLSDR